MDRAFGRCQTPQQREFVDKSMKATVARAQQAGAVWHIDWDVRPLPAIEAETSKYRRNSHHSLLCRGASERLLVVAANPEPEPARDDPLAMLRAFKENQQARKCTSSPSTA